MILERADRSTLDSGKCGRSDTGILKVSARAPGFDCQSGLQGPDVAKFGVTC